MDSSTLTPWMEIIYQMSKRVLPLVTWRSHEHEHHGVGDAAVRVAVAERVHLQADFVTNIVKYILSQRSRLISSQLVISPETWAGGWAAPPPPPPRRTPPA